jgi:hypothetical protein
MQPRNPARFIPQNVMFHFKKQNNMRHFILIFLFLIAQICYSQSKNNMQFQNSIHLLKAEVLVAFNDNTKPHFYLNTGNERFELQKFLNSPQGFSIHHYNSYSKQIEAGSSFVISLLKEPFLEYLGEFENDCRKFLKDNYDIVLKRLKNNEAFYIFDKGEKVNTLILCGQNKNDIVKLLKSLFIVSFQADALDSDNDGLPDYFEKAIKTNPIKYDTDDDGLSDYDEIFKYLTNPLKMDSDSDGIIDSDWNERREYTYTINVKREVYAPFDSKMMNDFFQDTKVIYETKDTLLFESILFPDAINFVIPSSKLILSKKEDDVLKYTQPSYFCNYTSEMKQELETVINEWSWANNYELANMYSDYCIEISDDYPANGPVHFFIEVKNKKVVIVHQEEFNELKTSFYTTNERVLDNQGFGAGMYKNRMHGSCGSSSVFYNTLYRAINFPTRIISSNPIINYSDTLQINMLKNLKHKGYRDIALSKVKLGRGYANHFFYEIFINGRWIRCDYDNVNIGCVHGQGLFTVQDKFIDFSERNFAQTWGKRMVEDLGNAYKTIHLSDQFPVHNE